MSNLVGKPEDRFSRDAHHYNIVDSLAERANSILFPENVSSNKERMMEANQDLFSQLISMPLSW